MIRHIQENGKCWRACGKPGTVIHSWWECDLLEPSGNQSGSTQNVPDVYHFPQQLSSSGTCQREMLFTQMCTLLLIAALFTKPPSWEQPKCSPSGEWINEWHVQSHEPLPAIKRSKVWRHTTVWLNFKDCNWRKSDWETWFHLYDILEQGRLVTESSWGSNFPGGPAVKNLPANAGDMALIPDLGRLHMPWSN